MPEMKTTFQDKFGNHWDLDLTFETIRRLQTWDYSKPILNERSLTAPSREMLMALMEDAGTLFEMIWSIVSPQAETLWREKTAEERELEFLKGIGINQIDEARTVFFNVLAFFSPEVSAVRDFQEEVKRMALETSKAKLAKAGEPIQRKIEEELERQIQSLTAEIETLNIGESLNSEPS